MTDADLARWEALLARSADAAALYTEREELGWQLLDAVPLLLAEVRRLRELLVAACTSDEDDAALLARVFGNTPHVGERDDSD